MTGNACTGNEESSELLGLIFINMSHRARKATTDWYFDGETNILGFTCSSRLRGEASVCLCGDVRRDG